MQELNWLSRQQTSTQQIALAVTLSVDAEIASDTVTNVDCHIDATTKAKQQQQWQHKCCSAER